MSIEDQIPAIHQHDELFVTLSRLNHYDKINSTPSDQATRYRWYRNPTGHLQGVTRTILNVAEIARRTALDTGNWVVEKARELLPEYILPAPAENVEGAPEQEPTLAADAVTNAKYINEELNDVSKTIEHCHTLMEKTENIVDLTLLLKHLVYLQAEMKAAHSGLTNLVKTYEYEKTNSLKNMLLGTAKKYVDAVEKLDIAEGELSANETSLTSLITNVKEKISSLNGGEPFNVDTAQNMGLSTAAVHQREGALASEGILPDDFPRDNDDIGGYHEFLPQISRLQANLVGKRVVYLNPT